MRSRIIVLLAVCSNVAVAGVLRHNEARAQQHNVARFLNNTEISSSSPNIQTSTTIPISSPSIIPSIAASAETSFSAPASTTSLTATPLTPNVVSSSSSSSATGIPTMIASSQRLSTSATVPTTLSTAVGSGNSGAGSEVTPSSTESAVVQPTDTASRLFNLAGYSSSDLQPSTNAQSFSSTSSPNFSASLSATSAISSANNHQNAAATPLPSSAANKVPSLFEESVNASATAGTSHVMPYSTTSMPTLSSDTASQSPSAVVIPVPISSGLVRVSAANGGAAEEFAPVTLDSSSPAPTGTAKYPTAGNGNAAMAAGFNSVYKTLNTDSPCNPSDPSQAYACVDGEIAECQSDGTYVLKSCPSLQSCYALPKASGLTGIVVQCAVPSDAYSILAGLSSSTAGPLAVTSQPAQTLQVGGSLSQTTQSVSVQSPAQPVPSSPAAQPIVQSQTMAPIPTVLAVTATPSQNEGSERVEEATVSTTTSRDSASQSQSQTLESPVLAVTATAQEVHISQSLNGSPTSSTPPSVPSPAAPIETIPDALFAVVTAAANGPVLSSENGIQSSLPTSSGQADPDGVQAADAASVTSTSTSSADGASITSAPTGVPVNEKLAAANGQATVTVTVTVTSTERPAPVTMSAS